MHCTFLVHPLLLYQIGKELLALHTLRTNRPLLYLAIKYARPEHMLEVLNFFQFFFVSNAFSASSF